MTTTKAAPRTKATPKATAPKPAPSKAAAQKEQKPEAKPQPKTLIEALTTGQAALTKIRGNGTKRSLPYLAVGTDGRKEAEAVAKMREDGDTVEAIAEALKVSTATARRFLMNLELAQAVEAGTHDKTWKPGAKEVVVHTVTAKA
jgi:hypothetical protein